MIYVILATVSFIFGALYSNEATILLKKAEKKILEALAKRVEK